MKRQHLRFTLLLASAGVAVAAMHAAVAQTSNFTLKTLHSFSGIVGTYPTGSLVKSADGTLYSVAGAGKTGSGIVYSITLEGDFHVVHVFEGGAEGGGPLNVILHDGALYGTTGAAGANGFGTAFKLTKAGKINTTHAFDGGDGNQIGPLAFYADGTFLGTSGIGGDGGWGEVFSISPQGDVSILHSFSFGDPDQEYPISLVLGADGNYYGTNLGIAEYAGGSGQAGTIWKLTPTGTFTTLHVFDWADGAQPLSAPIQGLDGNLYGTTSNGGPSGNGVVYRISPSGLYSIVYAFSGGADGSSPRGGIIWGSTGNLYGSTYSGGDSGWGTLFEVTTSGSLTTLHEFSGRIDGGSPDAALLETSPGVFVGSTESGGSRGFGTVYKLVIR